VPADAKAWLAGVFDRAAPSYDEVAGSYHEHFGRRLVDRAGVSAGERVLDVACGRGAALVPAAQRVGPAGAAVGVDLSPAMVRLARDALGRAGLESRVEVMDGEALAFPDGGFDRALCAFGVFFLPEPERAAAELHRVLRPGGVVALSTWGREDARWAWEDDLLAGVEVERRAIVRPFDDPGSLTELLDGAGFEAIEVAEETVDVRLADADEWWAWKWSYSLRGVLEQLPADQLDAMRRDAAAHLDAMREPEGLPLRLTALVVTASRPA
jgi:ubiquinone/menaquinone biosynthesis C-methylase UbiE